MKKNLKIILIAMFLVFAMFQCIKVDTFADTENEGLFDDFIITHASHCYYSSLDNSANDGEENYIVDLRLYVFEGTYNGSHAYAIYDHKENRVIEYSFNSYSPWNCMTSGGFIVFVYFEGGYHGMINLQEVALEDEVLKPDKIVIVDTDPYTIIESEAFCEKFSEVREINLDVSVFDFSENLIKKHDIQNSFYFQQLDNNYGDNLYGSCSYVAMGMLFSYYNEFIDNNIIPETMSLESNGNIINYFKNDLYTKSFDNEYNIKNFESPGANENFQQFLLSYGSTILNDDGEILYGLSYDQIDSVLEQYLNNYYDGDCNIGVRKVTNERYAYPENDYNLKYGFDNTYNYYKNQSNRNNLIVNAGTANEYEFELDIKKELDNNNPVLLCFTTSFVDGYNFQGYLETPGENVINVNNPGVGGHAVIAYGYVETETGVFYKCHMGWKNKVGENTYNEIYVSATGLVNGYVLKLFDSPNSDQESSYYYENDNCLMNLPTNNTYTTFEEFLLEKTNIVYENDIEYYYCTCGLNHLIYQKNHEHNLKYRDLDDGRHRKYCICGYDVEEEHEIVHTGVDCVEHYAYCIYCSFEDYHADGITYFVGEDPNLIPEHFHTWTCSICNLSGAWTHTLEGTSLGSSYHYLECKICEYEEAVPHGMGYNIELWIYKIDENTHSVLCIGCGETWIEEHTDSCMCN